MLVIAVESSELDLRESLIRRRGPKCRVSHFPDFCDPRLKLPAHVGYCPVICFMFFSVGLWIGSLRPAEFAYLGSNVCHVLSCFRFPKNIAFTKIKVSVANFARNLATQVHSALIAEYQLTMDRRYALRVCQSRVDRTVYRREKNVLSHFDDLISETHSVTKLEYVLP